MSGMVLTLAVVYRPRWVATFDDARYIPGADPVRANRLDIGNPSARSGHTRAWGKGHAIMSDALSYLSRPAPKRWAPTSRS